MKLLLCFGTRPEAIKMAPIYHEFQKNNFQVKVCVTAQHREMLDQVLFFFDIVPDYDLNLMQPNQTLNGLSSVILSKIDVVLADAQPDLVLVHGDTTTSSMVALAAFHRGIKVGHVEAGLRTYNKLSPFPEEINRQLISRIANIHFTPTETATQNLLKEGVLEKDIVETGNTVIDALIFTSSKIDNLYYFNAEIERLKKLIPLKNKLILVTGHRRENLDCGLDNLCRALLEVSKRDDVAIVFPVHKNPNVRKIVFGLLSKKSNIYLVEPVSYPSFVWLMRKSFLIVTDSGGIQEEAPTLGKPVIVTRSISERREGIELGFSILIGTDFFKIRDCIFSLLDNFKGFKNVINPYGKGDSSIRIVKSLLSYKTEK